MTAKRKGTRLSHDGRNVKQMQALNRKTCYIEGCGKRATTTVFDRPNLFLRRVCDHHIEAVIGNDAPEYRVCCPSCGCEFGYG